MVKNKGYTLVELIIVIAIMAILSGASFVTIGIIKESKRQTAVNTLNNQISSCLVRTKAISNAKNTEQPLCIAVVKRTDGAYAIMTGYIYGNSAMSDIKDSNGNALDPNDDKKCEAVLPKEIVKIEYVPSDVNQQFVSDGMVIQFIKSDGSTRYGGGEYKLYGGKTGAEKLYATISLDSVSGKNYIK